MNKRIYLICALLLAMLTACNDDDDIINNPITPAPRVEGISFNFEGSSYSMESIQVDFNASPQILDITGSRADGTSIGIGMMPIRAVGTYTTEVSLGLELMLGNEAWFCNDNCTVQVIAHDSGARWFEAVVSGPLSPLFGASTGQLTAARFAVYY